MPELTFVQLIPSEDCCQLIVPIGTDNEIVVLVPEQIVELVALVTPEAQGVCEYV